MDNLFASPLLLEYIKQRFIGEFGNAENVVICSPDAGGAKRAEGMSKELGSVSSAGPAAAPASRVDVSTSSSFYRAWLSSRKKGSGLTRSVT